MSTNTDGRRWKGVCEVMRLSKERGQTSVRISRPSKALLGRLEAEGCTWAYGPRQTIILTLPNETETIIFPEPQDTP